MSETVTTSIDDGVAVVRLDDGKRNAINHAMIEELHVALDRAERDAPRCASSGARGRCQPGST